MKSSRGREMQQETQDCGEWMLCPKRTISTGIFRQRKGRGVVGGVELVEVQLQPCVETVLRSWRDGQSYQKQTCWDDVDWELWEKLFGCLGIWKNS